VLSPIVLIVCGSDRESPGLTECAPLDLVVNVLLAMYLHAVDNLTKDDTSKCSI
jgi:hypothetical protein